MTGYFKYVQGKTILFKGCPLSIKTLLRVFDVYERIRIDTLFIQIYTTSDNEYLTEKDVPLDISIMEFIERLNSIDDYSVDAMKFKFVKNNINVTIHDDDLAEIELDKDFHINTTELITELITKMGFKDAKQVLEQLIIYKGKYVAIDDDQSRFEAFDDFKTLCSNTTIDT